MRRWFTALRGCRWLFKNAVGEIGRDSELDESLDPHDAPEWAKLNLHEFRELPEFETVKEVIDAKLDREALSHEFFDENDKSYLIFRVEDSPEVARCFDELADKTARICRRLSSSSPEKRAETLIPEARRV